MSTSKKSKKTITITIPNRFSGIPCWVGEIEDTGSDAKNLGRAVQAARGSGVSLSRANLSGADLSMADLSEVNLYMANLSGANLSGVNLSRADLSRADLSGADLSEVNLSWADLSGVHLSGANLSKANLSKANLSKANLSGVNLSGVNLSGAYLSGAYLSMADLSMADLSMADLSMADLSMADLSMADLSMADLPGVNLSGAYLSMAKNAELAIARTRILPEGSLIGYKKCRDSRIVRLRIPEDAKRSHAFGRKCRAERAEVLEITGSNGTKYQDAVSGWDSDVVYRVGETVVPANGFSENWMQECESGIHFYLTRIEAETN